MARKNELKRTSKPGIYTSINSKGEKEFFGKIRVNYKLKQINLTKKHGCKTLKESVNKLEVWRNNLINGVSGNYNSFDKSLDNYFRERFEKVKKDTEHSKDMLSFYDKYISKEIGHMKIDKIENQDIQKIINKLERLGNLSQRTIRKVQQCLRPCFNQMIKEKLVSHNPSTFLEYSKKINNKRNLEHILKTNLLDTIRFILEEVKKIENKKYKLMFYLTIYCVRRIGEVLSLEWEEVDLENQSIIVYDEDNKNDITTQYYIVDEIVELMKEIREEYPKDTYVFQTPFQRKDKVDPYYSDWTIRDIHKNIVLKLEKEGKIKFKPKKKYSNKNETILNLRPHDYRHFFGNLFRPLCQDVLLIKSILSHTDTQITTTYSQYTFEFIKKGLIDYYNLLNDIKVDNS